MKIIDVDVLVTSPGRNFVLVKIQTDDGLYGWGDATLKGVSSPWPRRCVSISRRCSLVEIPIASRIPGNTSIAERIGAAVPSS